MEHERSKAQAMMTDQNFGKLIEEVIQMPWTEERLSLSLLHIPHYQRDVRQEHVRRIVDGFNILIIGALMVSHREDGRYYVIDGQHRKLGIQERYGVDVSWPCWVYRGLTIEQEAMIFNMQVFRLAVSPLERFHAGVIAKMEPYLSILAIVGEAGWEIAHNQSGSRHGKIEAVGALINGHRSYRADVLTDGLKIFREAWGSEGRAPNAGMILAMLQFLYLYRGRFNRKALVERLSTVGREWCQHEMDKRRLLDGVASRAAFGMVLVNVYNKGRTRRTRIEPWEVASGRAARATTLIDASSPIQEGVAQTPMAEAQAIAAAL